MLKRCCLLFVATVLLPCAASAQNPDWPNAPDEDPRLQYPDDPGFIKFNAEGEVTGGQWNLWSFVPESWTKNKNFRQDEIAMGTGLHADRAWQRTIGDRRVIVAVLDSGINWDSNDLINKHYINRDELDISIEGCKPTQTDPPAADDFDIDGNGYFNIQDYGVATDGEIPAFWDDEGNQNGRFDPGDIIVHCSDGVDDDGNGFTDDIAGWDAFWNDNNPMDDTRYGHGTGESRDSTGAGNDGHGDIGVCPECAVMNVRAGDSFVVDVNDFATAVIYSVDRGAMVIQEALGSVNNTAYAMSAIEYAYRNNVAIIASAADELSFHHNMPGTNNHMLYVHAIVHDKSDARKSTTFLNFNNCTNYGAQLLLSTPGSACSSEAVGISAGHAGLIYSAALQANLEPSLSAEEMRGILIQSADDIIVPEGAEDPTKFPSAEGWDLHFGYGRNNARTSVDMVLDDWIPPEVDMAEPKWFEPINVDERETVDIMGRVGARVDGKPARYDNYKWEVDWALGVDPKAGWEKSAEGTGEIGGGEAPALVATWDARAASTKIDYTLPLTDSHQYTVTIRLKVWTEHGDKTLYNEYRKAVHLISDPDTLPGFPKYMGTSMEGSPKIFDIDGDGKEEIIVASTDGYVHAIKADGTQAAGFPTAVGVRADVNPDGPNNLAICAFQPADAKPEGCPDGGVDPGLGLQSAMMGLAIGALEGDMADISVVVPTYDGYVYVFDSSGEIREGWPQRTNPEYSAITTPDWTLDEGFFSAPVLFDLDNDGDLEILMSAMDMHLYVWHHDGSPMEGWPLLIHDPLETQRARIVMTPAVGDVDGDGFPEIVIGTNEAFGAGGAEQEARGYLLKHTGSPDREQLGPALEDGWPVSIFGITVNTLPLVGRGVPTNPALADIDGDGDMEIHLDALAFAPYFWDHTGQQLTEVNNFDFGNQSPSFDAPTFTLMNNPTFAKLDPNDTIDLLKGTAGFDFALTFAEGGIRAVFDHQLSAWDTTTGQYLQYWPQIMDDWQFFMNPTVVDINNDGHPDVLNGSGGYITHAFNYKGEEPTGWPKMTGGWITSSPAFGDLTGNGKWDVVNMTRNGFLFAWATEGAISKQIEWQTFGHDFHNTSNYDLPVAQYNDYPDEPAVADTGGTGDDTGDTGDDTGGTTDGATGGDTTGGDTTTDGATEPPPAEDEGCTAGQKGNSSSPWLVLLMVGFLALTRRRRVAPAL
ncbi:MAG: MYXO-CTERM domain-containing protein [Myxococcota bacterium]|jgi:MYXO-CTERM domain-containing protein